MKKAKFIFKVNNNYYAKVYVNKKWLKDVTKINLSAVPYEYTLEIEQYKRDKEGCFFIENIRTGEAAKKTTTYKFGRRDKK